MTYRSSYNPPDKTDYSNFAFKKSEILEILKGLNSNFSFDEHVKDKYPKSYKDFFYNYDVFNGFEVACLISGYDPNQLSINKTRSVAWSNENPLFAQALGLVLSADKEKGLFKYDPDSHSSYELDYTISNADLKKYLISKNIIISGFNDSVSANLSNEDSYETPHIKSTIANLELDIAIEQNTVKTLTAEIEKLKAELLEKDQKIKELESIQTSQNESKLGSTRAENNVAKLILALSAQAKIDTSKPYAQYESLKAQAELLGIDKFPSDENVASWLRRANSQNPN